ncbi:MAG TPA: PA14 domain-containing protein [Fervidobacterium sp.]|nr:PA14 domain-containing protein [Fervidobacterium sp.]
MKKIILTLVTVGLASCAKNKDHVEFQIPTEPAQIVINPPAITVNVTPNVSVTTGDVNVSVDPTINSSNNNTSTGGSVGNVSSTGGSSSATNGGVTGTISGGNNTATGGNGGAGGTSTSTSAGGAGGSNTNTNNVTSGNSTSAGGTGGGASAGNSTSNANNSGSNTTSNSGSVSNSGSQSATGGTSSNNNSNSSDTSSNSNSGGNSVTGSNTANSNSGGNTVSGQNTATNSELTNGSHNNHDNESDSDEHNGHKNKKTKKSTGLTCKVYNLSSTQPSTLPNFSNLTPVSTIIVDQLDVSDVDYAGSFPKFPLALKSMLEWYGLVCDGTIKVPKASTYTFYLTSDDGSKLYIDGNLLINNDGLHSTRAYQNNSTLSKGNHDVHIEYFQGPRTRISLVLEWSSSEFSRQVLNSSFLKH